MRFSRIGFHSPGIPRRVIFVRHVRDLTTRRSVGGRQAGFRLGQTLSKRADAARMCGLIVVYP